MELRQTQIERAFALAASGRVNNLAELRQALRQEGFPEDGQLYGNSIGRQLAKIISDTKEKSESCRKGKRP